MVRAETAKKQSIMNGTQRKRYKPEQLSEAITDVRERNVTLRDASAARGVPLETLRRHLAYQPGVQRGPPTVLSAAEEADLEHYLLKMAEMGLAIDRAQVAQYVLRIVDDGRDHPWKDPDSAGPGRDWFEGFLRRHPKLALRKSQKLERARAIMSNESVITHFFDLLKEAMNGVRPEPIFNCDETKVDGKPPKVFARKGQRAVNAIYDAPMSHVSVVGCGNATGTLVMPPALVTVGVNVQLAWYDRQQNDLMWAVSESGWMESDMFSSWMTHFITFLNRSRHVMPDGKQEPALLLFDGHCTHLTLQAIEKAENAGLRLVKFPAHCTHLLQPLDLSCFSPWHKHWGRTLHKFRTARPRTVVTKEIFAALFREPWDKAMSATNLRNGFRAAGIYPYAPNVVLDKVRHTVTSPATALDADPSQSLGAQAAMNNWPHTPLPRPRATPPSSGSTTGSHSHTPKRELVARIGDLTNELDNKDRTIEQLRQQLDDIKTSKRRHEILRFPFEDENGATATPATKRKKIMVNGAEFLTVEGFNKKLAEAAELKEQQAERRKLEARNKANAKREQRAAAKEAAKISAAGIVPPKSSISRAKKASKPRKAGSGRMESAGPAGGADVAALPARKTSRAKKSAGAASPE